MKIYRMFHLFLNVSIHVLHALHGKKYALVLLSAAVFCWGCTTAGGPADSGPVAMQTGWIRSERSPQSWVDLRDRHVVRQRFDYSCGAGALATLLHYYFGDPASEEQILHGILSALTEEQVRDRELNGLSLLDLKNYAQARGYQAVGAKLTYAGLRQLKGPVVVHLQRRDYKHFAVYKGTWGDRIHLADPSRGNLRLPVWRFSQEWTGVVLALGREGFGLPEHYPLVLDEKDKVLLELESARRSLYAH